MLLALTGGSGLVVVLPVAAWLVYLAIRVWRGGETGRAGLLLGALAVLPLLYLGVYSVGYQRPAHHPEPSTNPVAVGQVAGEVLAMSLGIGVSGIWWLVAAGIVVLGFATVVILLRQWKEPDRRLSVAGLIAVVAGVAGVAVAIGVGRAGFFEGHTMGLWSRYSMLTWPLLAAVYLVWVKLGYKWVPVALCVAAALAFPSNTGTGLLNAAAVKSRYLEIEADVALGLSAEQIVQKEFPGSAQSGQEERAVRAIPLLRARPRSASSRGSER